MASTSSYSDNPTLSELPATTSKVSKLLADKQASWDAQRPVQANWLDRERLLINRQSDRLGLKNTRSRVTDGHISTLAFERQARVAAQLPTGSIHSLDAKDEKSAVLMNLVLNKYILPNANSQMDALTKLRMSGVYASVYGAQPILYDYRVDDEYIGPDFWLIPPRSFYPQPGKNSIRDCDWVMISTIVSVSYLEALVKRKASNWDLKELKKLINAAKKGTVPQRDLDSSKKSAVEDIRSSGRPFGETGSSARVELVTKYEKGKNGHWITFAPDFKECDVLRDIPNPHKSGRIPVVMRQCFPLVDSIWGLGDFERGITIQKAKDSLINLYLDGVKLAIFPPLKIDTANVTYSSIKMEVGARWLMTDPNAVTTHDSRSADALNNFQGTYGALTTMLLNQFGTQDTTVSSKEAANPAFGKTPQAIEANQDREAARDNWDRFQLEKCLEDLFEGMINLLSINQEKPINFHIFDADVEQIIDQFGDKDDVTGKVTPPDFMTKMGKSAKMTIAKSLIKGNFKYIIDASSTMKQDEEGQNEALMPIIQLYLTNPQAIDQLMQKNGYQFNFGQALKSLIYNAQVNDPDSIVSKLGGEDGEGIPPVQPPQVDPAQLQQFKDPQIAQVAQQLFAQGQPQGVMPNGQ